MLFTSVVQTLTCREHINQTMAKMSFLLIKYICVHFLATVVTIASEISGPWLKL